MFRAIIAGLILLISSTAFAEEAILSYDSRIVVGTDGALDVTETIFVRAEGNQIRRGIYRDFPTDYKDRFGRSFNTTFDVLSVTLDGGPVKWTTERLSNGTRVRIGDADVFLRSGEYTYTIRYKTERQLYFGDGFDELYYNVTGNGWAFPIYSASATVVVPDGGVIDQTRAYTGPQGSSAQNASIEHLDERQVRFETSGLGPREGLTVVTTWPEGFVTRPTEAELAANFLEDNLSLIIAYLGFLGISAYFYFTWKQVGKDPDLGPIYARYGPPKGLSPAAVGYVKGRDYTMAQFSAAIVSMAVKGALDIAEVSKKKFKLMKTPKIVRLSPGEQAVYNELFAGRESIETHHTKHSTFQKARSEHKKVLENNHENIHFVRNQKHFWLGAGISLAVAAIAMTAEAATGAFEMALLGLFIVVYGSLFWALKKRMGLMRAGTGCAKAPVIIGFGFLGVHFMGMAGALFIDNFFLIVPFALIIGVNILFFNLLEKPTIEGAALLAEIEGFKKYLTMAEKDRLEFHTGTITPEKFEEYLPYAIALGVENKWGKAFEREMTKAGQDPAKYSPTWYHGGRYYGFSGSRSFGSAFGAAFAGAVVSASSPPSRGGSGGGGFSGGGGGGGGGGGW